MTIILQTVIAVATSALAVYTALMWKATATVAEQSSAQATQTQKLANETHALADQTQVLARETLAAAALSDRHHQESLTPLLVFDGNVTFDRNRYIAKGKLRNVGTGIALEPRIWIGELGQPSLTAPLAARAARSIECSVSTTDSKIRPNQLIKLVLLYKSIFKSEGKTEHHGKCDLPLSFNTVVFSPPIVDRTSTFEAFG